MSRYSINFLLIYFILNGNKIQLIVIFDLLILHNFIFINIIFKLNILYTHMLIIIIFYKYFKKLIFFSITSIQIK